jgi:hypothetical protein
MSVLVIGIFSLFLVLAMAEVNLSTGYQVLNQSEAIHSYYAAEACMEESVLRYERDNTFTGTTLAVDSETSCTSTVTATEVTVTITNGSYSEVFMATISPVVSGTVTNVHLTGWKEN